MYTSDLSVDEPAMLVRQLVLLLKQNVNCQPSARSRCASGGEAKDQVNEISFDSVKDGRRDGSHKERGPHREAKRSQAAGVETPRPPASAGQKTSRGVRSPYHSAAAAKRPSRIKTASRGIHNMDDQTLSQVQEVLDELVKAVCFWAGESQELFDNPPAARVAAVAADIEYYICSHCAKEVRQSDFYDGSWCSTHLCTHDHCTPETCTNHGRAGKCRVKLEQCTYHIRTADGAETAADGCLSKPPLHQSAKKLGRKFVPRLPCGLPLIAPDAKVRRATRQPESRARQRGTGESADEDVRMSQPALKQLSSDSVQVLKVQTERSSDSLPIGSSLKQNSARSVDSLGRAVGSESSIRLLLLETVWEMIKASNLHSAICLEGLLREGLYDVVLLHFQSRLGHPVEEEDFLAIKIYERVIMAISELSNRRLSPKQMETAVDIMLRYKNAFDTPPLKYLEEDAIAMLASLSKTLIYEPGELVLAQGSIEPCSYIVISGLLQMAYTSKRYHKMHVLAKLRAGDIFGSEGVLHDAPSACAASITATSRSTLIQIPREALVKVAQTFSISPLLLDFTKGSTESETGRRGDGKSSPSSPRAMGQPAARTTSPCGELQSDGGIKNVKITKEAKKLVRAIARRASGHFVSGLIRLTEMLHDLVAPHKYSVERPGFSDALLSILSAVSSGMSDYDLSAVFDAGMLPVLLQCGMREPRGNMQTHAWDILNRVCSHRETQQKLALAPHTHTGGFLHDIVLLLRPEGNNARSLLRSVNTTRVSCGCHFCLVLMHCLNEAAPCPGLLSAHVTERVRKSVWSSARHKAASRMRRQYQQVYMLFR